LPDGDVLPEQRSERRLLSRADRTRNLQDDSAHRPAARAQASLSMVHESDVCIIGGGITSAMLALKLSELRPRTSIVVVEAGRSIFDAQNRGRYRDRALAYGEHPWHDDYIEDQQGRGTISMTM